MFDRESKKTVRLKGRLLAELNEKIHERDNGCVLCSAWVNPLEKIHHVVFRSHGGSDSVQNCVVLCLSCHRIAHGEFAKEARGKLLDYLGRANT